jgi:hypothetical protein
MAPFGIFGMVTAHFSGFGNLLTPITPTSLTNLQNTKAKEPLIPCKKFKLFSKAS